MTPQSKTAACGVIPGSHRPGVIWPAKEHDDERFDCVVGGVRFSVHGR